MIQRVGNNVGIVAIIATFIALLACSFQTNPSGDKKMIPIVRNDHAEAWRVIDSLESKGLPKSALEKVTVLLSTVRAEKNAPQVVKCLLYREKYNAMLEEEGYEKAIGRIEEELKGADFPTKPVLQTLLAEMYSVYLSNNRWKFSNRTEIEGGAPSEDISTWTQGQFVAKSIALYEASLEDLRTQEVSLRDFGAILGGGNEEGYNRRNTLYDFLLFRALEHFGNEQTYLTAPAYKFIIDDKRALAGVEEFVKARFETKDVGSLKYKTLLLYQTLLKEHESDTDPTTLVDADLKRLSFVYDHAVVDDKEALYVQALERLMKKYEKYPISTEVIYELASYYNRQSGLGAAGDEAHKFDNRKAMELCDQATKAFKDSYGAQLCRVLQSQITAPQLNITMGNTHPQNDNILGQIRYTNVATAYIRVVPITKTLQETLQMGSLSIYDQVAQLCGIVPVQGIKYDLPNDGDYLSHTLNVPIQGLPYGLYAVLISDNLDFSTSEGKAAGFAIFQVSDMAHFVYQNMRGRDEGENGLFVVHRNTGEPLKGVTVTFYNRNFYNERTQRYEKRKEGEGITDERGFVLLPKTEGITLEFARGKDMFYTDERYYWGYGENSYESSTCHFFLDRAIYRPGQTIYFKGLLVHHDKKRMPSILKGVNTEVVLYDANHQEKGRVKVTSNDFGTFSGTFNAPQGGMNGVMYISCTYNQSQKDFRVEDYKRPKFEVNFEPIKGSYRIDEKVTVTGKAVAYAGSNIDGAAVNYRVVRRVSFPWWRWWYWGWYNPYQRDEMEITNGSTKTDAEGKFNVEFTALADKSIPKERQPLFQYVVIADVVDITGETHSQEVSLSVGYVAVQLSTNLSDMVQRDTLQDIVINSTNINGVFEPAKGKLDIVKLKTPNRAFRERQLGVPDKFVMSQEAFYKMFPLDAYKDENEVQNWAVEASVVSTDFDTERTKKVALNTNNWKQGVYKITLQSKDRFGSTVEHVRFVTVYDKKSTTVPNNAMLWHTLTNGTAEPGQTATIRMGSASGTTHIFFYGEHDQTTFGNTWLKAKDIAQYDIPIEEKHRGGLFYNFAFVRNNRIYTRSGTINVPWTNKDLKIEYATFRDKLYPGQDETWTIKISGKKTDKVTAEMVAALYDASLDEFASNSWGFQVFPTANPRFQIQGGNTFNNTSAQPYSINWHTYNSAGQGAYYPYLNWFGFGYNDYRYRRYRGRDKLQTAYDDGPVSEYRTVAPAPAMALAKDEANEEMLKKPTTTVAGNVVAEAQQAEQAKNKPKTDYGDVKVRTNLNETVFFFPHLMTDEQGNVIIKFKMNEALTKWKFLGFAHTTDLQSAVTQNYVQTQKDLMVMPNVPRFVRETDEIELTAKVSNLTNRPINGTAILQLLDATNLQPIDALLGNTKPEITFSTLAKQSAPLQWKLKIPLGAPPVTYRVIAKAGNFSDGEENTVPTLTNRMLVTETLPLPVRGNQTKTFDFKAMREHSTSNTLTHHQLTLEFTSNPAWYAVKALPYLMEYPYECTEQIFSRYYANILATTVANAHPKVKQVFDRWKETPTALESNLSKNQELKYALLEETPWVFAAQSEAQQMKNVGLLFDLNKMSYELENALKKLTDRQLSNGGFTWFPGERHNWYISQYIVEGMGHLNHLGVKKLKEDPRSAQMLQKAVAYCDEQIAEDYNLLLKRVKEGYAKLEDNNLGYIHLHYLYARSFFTDQPITKDAAQVAHTYYLNQAKKFWLQYNQYSQGLIALALHRYQDTNTPAQIVKSLKENSLNNDEMGMYWKYETGWYWYQMPTETQALMVEVFDEVANDPKAVDDLKVWLLKNKQTNAWTTTKATASAVYALLLRGDNWLLDDQPVQIKIANKILDQTNIPKEAGSGYFKTNLPTNQITSETANIEIKNPNKVPAWGAMYWQYFETLDKIKTFRDTPLKINKTIYKVQNTPTGPKLIPLSNNETLKPGDEVKIRIELRVDRDMEYVHMKDMRASGLEPINVLSTYKWQGGLGYYESTRDAATNFFFSWLPKGSYIFEYPLRANLRGNFSNGITTIQCMYAPEFTSHSEGIRLNIQ